MDARPWTHCGSGRVCDSFNATRGKKICESSGSLIENNKTLSFEEQIKILRVSANFIDDIKYQTDPVLSQMILRKAQDFLAKFKGDDYIYGSMLGTSATSTLQRDLNFEESLKLKAGKDLLAVQEKLDYYERFEYAKKLSLGSIKTFSDF